MIHLGVIHCTALAPRSNSDRTSDFNPMRNDSLTEADTDHAVSHREWLLLGGILVIAAILRLVMPWAFHVEHYDEGVYASNRWFTPEEGARYPDRHLYAPPLWPAVLEFSQLALGTSSLGVMLPGILCGVISVWFIWKIVREWVGRTEAAVSATLLALSGYHIYFSRSALTDVPVVMWMLGAIYLAWKSLDEERVGLAIGAGIVTGLAWSTKYSGWFPLAVSGAGLLAANLFHVKAAGVAWKKWCCWSVMVLVAAIVWMPAWLDLQDEGRGGYSAVAGNHAGYIDGWSSWLMNFRRQFENLRWWDLLGSWAGRFSLPLICLSLTLFGMGTLLVGRIRSSTRKESIHGQVLSGWMALAWGTSLLLMTPLYRPYPRLGMAMFVALVMGAGYGIRTLLGLLGQSSGSSFGQERTAGSHGRVMVIVWGMLVLVTVFVAIGPPLAPHHGSWPWSQERLSAERVATQVVQKCAEESAERQDAPIAYVLYVYAEPAIYYHLCRLAPENVLISPVANLGFLTQPPSREPVPIYLLTGPHAERDVAYRKQWETSANQLEPIQTFAVDGSDLLSLNAHSPKELSSPDAEFPAIEFHLSVMTSSVE